MHIDRKWVAVLSVLVAVNVVLAGLLYLRSLDRPADPYRPRQGFGSDMTPSILLPSHDPNRWEERPAALAGRAPGYSMEAGWEAVRVYAVWGGDLRSWVKNTGSNDLFIYSFALEGDWGAAITISVGLTVHPGEQKYLGLLHFPGPPSAGTHNFTFRTGLLARAPGDLIALWHDYGVIGNFMKPQTFRPLAAAPHYKEIKNPAYFFDRANKVMNSNDPAVVRKSGEIASRFSGGYSIYQAAAAFDFVHNNMTYASEPAGRDLWQPPSETLSILKGDCEDYTLLLSALITAMGGTTRFHVENDHAFLSVYAGTDLPAAADALSRYYNTDLELASFHDGYGYWLAADGTDSMFLGGIPLGGEPLEGSGWGLTNTTFHYPVDMLPD